MTTNTH